jgi:lysozyme
MEQKMTYSETGMLLTRSFEGCLLGAYQDQKGVWTIGWGHTKDVKEGDSCTWEQAQLWLWEDLHSAEEEVNNLVTTQLNQGQFDALVDFVYNLGPGNFESSTLLRDLNTGDLDAAANEFDKWDHVSGQVVAGLLRRREAERKEFLGEGVEAPETTA